MEGAKFITRIKRHLKKGGTTTNEYSFAGLIEAATPFALERIEAKKKNMTAAAERAKRKKPVLTIIK